MKDNGDNRRNRIQRFIWSRIRAAQHLDIQDVAQEAHCRLQRLLKRGGSVEDPKAYVDKIASNVAKDFALKDSKERALVTVNSDELTQHLDQAEAPAWLYDVQKAVELEQELEWLTKHLPRPQFTALILCLRDGYTREEAAEALQVSIVTIRRWIADAIAHCQRRAKLRITRGIVK